MIRIWQQTITTLERKTSPLTRKPTNPHHHTPPITPNLSNLSNLHPDLRHSHRTRGITTYPPSSARPGRPGSRRIIAIIIPVSIITAARNSTHLRYVFRPTRSLPEHKADILPIFSSNNNYNLIPRITLTPNHLQIKPTATTPNKTPTLPSNSNSNSNNYNPTSNNNNHNRNPTTTAPTSTTTTRNTPRKSPTSPATASSAPERVAYSATSYWARESAR